MRSIFQRWYLLMKLRVASSMVKERKPAVKAPNVKMNKVMAVP